MEMYYDAANCVTGGGNPTVCYPAALADLVADGYLPAIPDDPTSGAYAYTRVDDHNYCILSAELEANAGNWAYTSQNGTGLNAAAACP
jgi:hypothetical protein